MPTLYCAMLYIVACVDVSRTVFRDCSNELNSVVRPFVCVTSSSMWIMTNGSLTYYWLKESSFCLNSFYCPQTKLQEDNVFTHVCLSAHRGGSAITPPWDEIPLEATWGQTQSDIISIKNNMGQTGCDIIPPEPESEQYTSYCNAFLFLVWSSNLFQGYQCWDPGVSDQNEKLTVKCMWPTNNQSLLYF